MNFEASGWIQDRKPYPCDVSDEEWAFVSPYLTLVKERIEKGGCRG